MDYQEQERSHYNRRYNDSENISDESKSVLDLVNTNAIDCFYGEVVKIINQNATGVVLDYGCGTGIKSAMYAKAGWHVHGIDISDKSIDAGNKILGKNPNIKLSVMDCENTSFDDNSFDIIFDYGTFSSIDIEIAIKEILRVLKPQGALICIETLGHNPFANLKRRINQIVGKRTSWATNHIMTVDRWKFLKKHFDIFYIKHFNLLTMFFIPLFVILPDWKIRKHFLKQIWKMDQLLLNHGIFQKYAFKTVTVLKNKAKK